MPDDQRSHFCPAGKCRHAGSDRSGDEAGDESSDGTARTCGSNWPGRGFVHYGSFAARSWRGQISPGLFIEKNGGRWAFGKKKWQRVLQLLSKFLSYRKNQPSRKNEG